MTSPEERFDEILAACLDELETGRTDVHAIAARYPEYPELAELLTLAENLADLPAPRPNLDREEAARDRVRRALDRRRDSDSFFDQAVVEPAGAAVFAGLMPSIGATASQRRRHPRVLVSVPGLLSFRHQAVAAPPRSLPVTVVDVSRGGLGLRSVAAIAPGATVEIDLALPLGPDPGSGVAHVPDLAELILPRLDAGGLSPTIGRIVHCAPEANGRGSRFRVGVVFEGSAA